MDKGLYHFGIKGMKWGVRRTPKQLGHKTGGKPKKSAKQAAQKGGDARAERRKNRRLARKKPERMTDEELRQRISRLTLEKQYKDLEGTLHPKKKSAIKKLISEATTNMGRKALGVVADKAADSLKNKLFKEKKYTLSDFDRMDMDKLDGDTLKRAAQMYTSRKIIKEAQKAAGKKASGETQSDENPPEGGGTRPSSSGGGNPPASGGTRPSSSGGGNPPASGGTRPSSSGGNQPAGATGGGRTRKKRTKRPVSSFRKAKKTSTYRKSSSNLIGLGSGSYVAPSDSFRIT